MSQEAATATIDTDELPPTQYLIMEVLAARYRTGETLWTFPSRLRSHVEQLADIGLIGWKSGIVPKTVMAWLTDAGKASALSATYVPPSSVGRCGAGAGVTTWTSGLPQPICALPAGHPGWHRADNGCEWGIPGASQP